MSDRVYVYRSKYVANWDRISKVKGQVSEKATIKYEGKTRPYIMIETDDGQVQVFESAGLADLFASVKVGMFAEIEYMATVTTKAGRPFRQFRAAVWVEANAPAVVVTKDESRAKSRR